MKKESVTLKENEFIVNHIQQLHNGCTLIESPTGTGKTSFVLEHLTQSEKILMLVLIEAKPPGIVYGDVNALSA